MNRPIRTSFALAFALSVGLVAPSTWADGEPSKEDQDAARALLESAAAARAKKDFTTCREQTSIAFKKFHHAQIAGLLGLCEIELGQYKDGATHVAEFLRTATNVSAESTAEAEAALAKAKVHLAEVTLSCTPPGVELSVDGVVVGTGPVTVYLEPGERLIEAKKEGYDPGIQKKALLASTEVNIQIALNPTVVKATKPAWPWILGASVAAVGVGVGVAGTVVALGKKSQQTTVANTECTPVTQACLTKGQGLAKQQGTFQTMGTTGFIVGGAALAATIIYLVIPARASATTVPTTTGSLPHFTPVVGPTGSGLWLDGSF